LERDEAAKAGEGLGGVSEGDDWSSEEDDEWSERSGGVARGDGAGESLKCEARSSAINKIK
jgi:hypothetical protein